MRISDWSSDVCSSDLDRRSDPQSSRLRPLAGEQSLPGGRPCAGGANPGAVESRQVRGWHESARLDVHDPAQPLLLGASQAAARGRRHRWRLRSEEHTSELQSLMRSSYAVFCLKKKNKKI